MASCRKNKIIFGICTATIILLDRFSKILVDAYMNLGDSYGVIDNFFSIHYVANTGVAFSNFQGNRIVTILMPVFIAVLITGFVFLRASGISIASAATLGMIVGGGIANLADRFIYGYVIDFFSFGSFAIFNIADVGITLGCVFLMLIVIFEKERK